MSARDRVASLLSHYFSTISQAAGVGWDSDNEAEIAELADAIEQVAVDQVHQHADNAPHIYPDGSTS